MTDPRIIKLANILVNYSIAVKKGEIIKRNSGIEAQDLTLECAKLILKKGAYPRIDLQLPGYSYIYYKYASLEQLNHYPKISEYELKNIDAVMNIGCEYNTKELSNVDPKKISIRRKVTKKLSDIIIKKDRWVYFRRIDRSTGTCCPDAPSHGRFCIRRTRLQTQSCWDPR